MNENINLNDTKAIVNWMLTGKSWSSYDLEQKLIKVIEIARSEKDQKLIEAKYLINQIVSKATPSKRYACIDKTPKRAIVNITIEDLEKAKKFLEDKND